MLNQNCGPLWRYASLLKSCNDKPFSAADQDALDRHGIQKVALAESVLNQEKENKEENGEENQANQANQAEQDLCQSWLKKYAAGRSELSLSLDVRVCLFLYFSISLFLYFSILLTDFLFWSSFIILYNFISISYNIT